jgi:cell pole-organizing protein PopZ
MSKPEATTAKSLEEIIASIRKSLAGQGGAAGGRGNGSKSERIEPELALPVDGLAKEPDPADGLFADRLAGALKGANGAAMDDDLSDILAQDDRASAAPRRTVPEPPVAEDKPPEMPWRVDRSAAREAVATAPIELSRPEELRRSLPPLFGEAQESAAVPTMDAPLPAPAAHGPGKRLDDILPAPALARAPAADKRTPEAAAASAKAGEASAGAVAPPIGPPLGAPAAEAIVERSPAIAATAPSPAVAMGAEAGAAKPSPALASRALEQVIAELLEPVIRHWLDANLPGLIERVVREEVVKAIAAERASPKS